MAIDNIKDSAQALLQNKGEVFGFHSDKQLVLAPDIYGYIDTLIDFADNRTRFVRRIERTDVKWNLLILNRSNTLRVNDLRAAVS